MEVFISLSKKSVRKASKTLKKKRTVGRGPKRTAKSGFHKLSRRGQIMYLKKHPNSRFSLKDVKPKSKGTDDGDVNKRPKKVKVTKRAKQPNKKKDETSASPTKQKNAKNKQFKTKSVRETASKALNLFSKSRGRAKTVAKSVMRKQSKEDISDTLEAMDDLRSGKEIEPKKKKSTLKTLAKVALVGLAVAGGAALATQVGPVGLVLAKDFISQVMWDSGKGMFGKSSMAEERHQEEFVELTKSFMDYISSMDEEQLAELIKQAESESKK